MGKLIQFPGGVACIDIDAIWEDLLAWKNQAPGRIVKLSLHGRYYRAQLFGQWGDHYVAESAQSQADAVAHALQSWICNHALREYWALRERLQQRHREHCACDDERTCRAHRRDHDVAERYQRLSERPAP